MLTRTVIGSDSSVCTGPCSGALYSPGDLLGSYESQSSNIFFHRSHREGTVLKTYLLSEMFVLDKREILPLQKNRMMSWKC